MTILEDPKFIEGVLNSFGEPFYVIRVEDYSIVLANQAARTRGVEQARTCYLLTHNRDTPCDGKEHPCPLKMVVEERKPYAVEHIHYKSDGTPYYAEVHGYPLFNDKGEVEYMVEYAIDVTERKSQEAQLRLLQRAVEFSGNGIVITNTEGVIEFVNPAFTAITGYSAEEVIGQTPRILKSGEHSPDFYADLWKSVKGGGIWRGEMANRNKDGRIYWEYQTIAPVRDTDGNITHFIAIKENITARKETEQELERLAYTDPLTGLANRRHFFHHAEMFFNITSHPSSQLSALMVDIDHFKKVNDQYGHAVGDEVLHEVAERLNRNIRPSDLIGRYGGEEFSFLLSRTDFETVILIAERLRAAVAEMPIQTQSGDLSLSVSIGVAYLTSDIQSLDELLRAADDALYQAKNSGRNKCVVYKKNKM